MPLGLPISILSGCVVLAPDLLKSIYVCQATNPAVRLPLTF